MGRHTVIRRALASVPKVGSVEPYPPETSCRRKSFLSIFPPVCTAVKALTRPPQNSSGYLTQALPHLWVSFCKCRMLVPRITRVCSRESLRSPRTASLVRRQTQRSACAAGTPRNSKSLNWNEARESHRPARRPRPRSTDKPREASRVKEP